MSAKLSSCLTLVKNTVAASSPAPIIGALAFSNFGSTTKEQPLCLPARGCLVSFRLVLFRFSRKIVPNLIDGSYNLK